MMFDTAIIGGGLAGLALSIDLTRRGYSVIVIEKGDYPRHKVCGEYISMESHEYLKNICPELTKLNLPQITKFKLSSTGKTSFNTTLDLGGFGISRYLLEDLLFIEAKNIGVTFMLNQKASDIQFNSDAQLHTIITNSNIVNANLVCNATGRKSNFETKDKPKKRLTTNYVGVKYHIRIDKNVDVIEIHNFPGGYCGTSKIEDGKSCLCYIVNSKKLNSVNNSITELEKRFLYKNKNLKELFTTAEFVSEKPVTISGINFQIKESFSDNIFFLGDSAGSIAPITGNGMSMALKSSFILAHYIDNYFSKKTTKQQLIDNYKEFWNKEFSIRIKLSRHFQKLSEYPFLTNITIRLFNTFPSIAKSVIRHTHGKPFKAI